MAKALAIISPQMGAVSETFIKRHIEELLPNKTAVIANRINYQNFNNWETDYPYLVLNKKYKTFKERICQGVIRNIGLKKKIDFKQVEKFLEQHKTQVVLGEYLDYSVQWLAICKKLNIDFFAHAHGCDISSCLHDAKWRKKYLLYNQAAGIITMSNFSRKKLIDIGIKAAKIHIIPYSVNVPSKPYQRSEREVVNCFSVGRMVAKKAPLLLLNAFKQAVDVFPDLHLHYVGTGTLFSTVKQFIHDFNLTEKVTLHGSLAHEQVLQLMKGSDIFLQHSIVDPITKDEEGLPVAILEAMAHNLPVVSTYHAGIPEAVENSVTGFLVAEKDVSMMAQKIITLAQEPELRKSMGLAGWNKAKESYIWAKEKNSLLRTMGLLN